MGWAEYHRRRLGFDGNLLSRGWAARKNESCLAGRLLRVRSMPHSAPAQHSRSGLWHRIFATRARLAGVYELSYACGATCSRAMAGAAVARRRMGQRRDGDGAGLCEGSAGRRVRRPRRAARTRVCWRSAKGWCSVGPYTALVRTGRPPPSCSIRHHSRETSLNNPFTDPPIHRVPAAPASRCATPANQSLQRRGVGCGVTMSPWCCRGAG
jgi:hypothetical protein